MTQYTHTGVDQQGDMKRDKSFKRTKTRIQTESTIFVAVVVNHSWSVVNVLKPVLLSLLKSWLWFLKDH